MHPIEPITSTLSAWKLQDAYPRKSNDLALQLGFEGTWRRSEEITGAFTDHGANLRAIPSRIGLITSLFAKRDAGVKRNWFY